MHNEVLALLDTGATINCIGENTVNKYKGWKDCPKTKLRSIMKVSTADVKTELTFKYILHIPIEIFGRKFQVPFHIAEEAETQVILGIPFMRKARVQIAYDDLNMYVCFDSQLKVPQTEKIPPMSEKIVMAQLQGHFTEKYPVLIKGDTINRYTTKILRGRTLTSANPDNSMFPVLLSNVSSKEIESQKKSNCWPCIKTVP